MAHQRTETYDPASPSSLVYSCSYPQEPKKEILVAIGPL